MPKKIRAKTIAQPTKQKSSHMAVVIGTISGVLVVTLIWASISLIRGALSPSADPIVIASNTSPSEQQSFSSGQARGDDSFSALKLIQDAPTINDTPSEQDPPPEQPIETEPESTTAAYPLDSWTMRYAKEMGIEPSAHTIQASLKEQPELVKQFIKRHAADTALPDIPEGTVTTIEENGKDAISSYLKQISVNHNDKLHAVEKTSIVAAFGRATQPLPSFTELDAILLTLASNIETLEAISVPREALSLHRTYLSATMALFIYTEDLRTYHKDPVGALIAATRIDNLQTVYNEAEGLIKELENKYNIN